MQKTKKKEIKYAFYTYCAIKNHIHEIPVYDIHLPVLANDKSTTYKIGRDDYSLDNTF